MRTLMADTREGRVTTCEDCEKEFITNKSGSRQCPSCINKKKRRDKRALVQKIKETVPCFICKEPDPIVKQFHHLDPETKLRKGNRAGVGGLTSSSISMGKLKREIAKCVLLCANCHLRVEAGTVTLPSREAGLVLNLAVLVQENVQQDFERESKQPSMCAPASLSERKEKHARKPSHYPSSRKSKPDVLQTRATSEPPSYSLAAD